MRRSSGSHRPRRGRLLRRSSGLLTVLPLMALATMVVAPEPELVAQAEPTLSFAPLMHWLRVAAAGKPDLPVQEEGTAKGKPVRTDAAATDAHADARGKARGKGPGELPEFEPHESVSKTGRGGSLVGRFDKKTSKRVQSASSKTSDMFQNADGSFTREIHARPVNFLDNAGIWQPIDTRLTKKPDGRLHIGGGEVDVQFAPSSADAGLAKASLSPTQSVGYRLDGAADVPGVVDGSTVAYTGVLPQTDLELSATPSGIKESIVLRGPPAQTSWDFPLQLKGLSAHVAPGGSVELLDAAGAVVGEVPHGYMTDSKVDPRSGEAASSLDVTYALVDVAGVPVLRVSADPAWLADPARVYPVTVDPTVNLSTNSDTYVEQNATGDHSGDQRLKVGTWDNGVHIANSFLKFDALSTTYSGMKVSSASLKLWETWSASGGCTAPGLAFNVAAVGAKWDSTTLTTYPGVAYGSSIGSLTKVSPTACSNTGGNIDLGEWVTVPLSVSTFNDWTSRLGTNYGLALYAAKTGTSWKMFGSVNSAYNPTLVFTYTPNVVPQVDSQYPPDNYSAPTLTPELLAYGHDADSWPSTLSYQFTVATTAGTVVAQSALQSSTAWKVPSAKLKWGQTYLWWVQTFDGYAYSANPKTFVLSTPVPQSITTSSLSQNTDGHGFEPSVGNYTVSDTDAEVESVGPDVDVERSYNSLDPRVTQAFGAGWSSIYDTKATEVKDSAGTFTGLSITYPDGEDVVFGRNADGTFAPPSGRYSTLKAVTGGYTLTDKDQTVYTFTQLVTTGVYGITSITDASGRKQTFTWTTGKLTKITGASGRSLNFTWATPTGATAAHVSTVVTDPVTAGVTTSALTWTYTYSGDKLASVCSPVSMTKCTTYTYTSNTQYPGGVLGAGPVSYWRFGENAGATRAASEVLANGGTDAATYSNVTLGAAGSGSLPGSAETAAAFNGTNSSAQILSKLSLGSSYQSISLRFKTSTAGGVLFSYQGSPLSAGTITSNYTPALYVGSDGKLYGEFWMGTANPIVTTPTVTDGKWHQVVLTATGNTQAMYLDGALVGTRAGQVAMYTSASNAYIYVGSGYVGNGWPSQPRFGNVNAIPMWFNGSISDVAFFDQPLTASTVTTLTNLGKAAAPALATIVQPEGGTYATVTYDTSTGRVANVVDADGGMWALGTPSVSGSSLVYQAAALGAGPQNYWRMAESAAADAVNEVNGDLLSYRGSVVLGGAGPFATAAGSDSTSAAFNGTDAYGEAMSSVVSTSGNQSVSLWFKTTAATGVLVGYHADPITNGTTAANYVPLLYLDDAGKLRGQYWDGVTGPITSTAAVTDGKWHHVVLAATGTKQTMYLDGATVGTKSGTIALANGSHAEVGVGYISSNWPGIAGKTTAVPDYFAGSLAEVSIHGRELPAATVTGLWNAGKASTGVVPVVNVTVTDPSNKVISYSYDPRNGNRMLSTVDALGGQTQYGYDTSGFLYTVTDPNGNVTTTGHDIRGNIVAQTTCQDLSTNKCGTTYFTHFPDNTTANPAADLRNDLITTVKDARSASSTDTTYQTSFTYDTLGNQTSVTSPSVTTVKPDGTTVTGTRTDSTTYTSATSVAADGGVPPIGLVESRTEASGAKTTYSYFKNGDLATETDPAGLVTSYTYDGLGRTLTEKVVSDTYPAGLVTSYTYDGVGQVLTQTDPGVPNLVTGVTHTARTTTVYDANGNATSQTVSDTTGGDPARTTSATYDTRDRVATSTDPVGGVTTYGYDTYGNMTSKTDANGVQTKYAYDAESHLTTTTVVGYTGSPDNPSAATDVVESSRAYDPSGRLASITDSTGRTTEYTYTDDGLLATVIRRNIARTRDFVIERNTYDAAGNLVTKVSNDGATTTNLTVDAAGRTTSVVLDPTGLKRTTTYGYTADDYVATTKISDASGGYQLQTASFDALGRMTKRVVTGGVAPATTRTTTWTLDKRGVPVSTTDPLGKVTTFTYDQAGQLAKTVEPSVNVEANGAAATATNPTTWSGYDTFGEETQSKDPLGNVSTATYDAAGHVLTETQPAYTAPGATTAITATATHTYDKLGQLLTDTDPLGNVTTYAYDQLGDVTSITTPDLGVTKFTFDTDGKQLSVTDPTGAQHSDTYDFLNRKITSTDVVTFPAPKSLTTSYTYTTGGWLGTETSPDGVVTTYSYNAAGETTKIVDGAGNATSFGYDFAGRRTRTTNPDATASTASYDDGGNMVGEADLDALGTVIRSASASYDLGGQMLTRTDARGNTSTFTYDATGAVTSEVQPVDATTSITTSFGYDAEGNRTRFTDGRGNVFVTTYNSWGLPESQIEPATTAYPGASDRTFTAAYDANGRIAKVTMPGGVSVTNTYDVMGNLTGSTGAGADAATAARTFGYDKAGRITSISAPGANDTFSYDERGLLLSTSGPSGTSSFEWTNDGLMSKRTDAAGITTYGYDTADRLSTMTDPLTGVQQTVAYDVMSNPKSVTYGTGDVRSFGYDALHRLTSDTLRTSGGATVASIGYGYDNGDNITSKTTTGFAGASANTYTYDKANRLTSWGNGTTTLAYEYDASGNRTKAGSTTYTYDARNQLLGDDTRTFTYTARGTTKSVASAAGTVSSTSDAFGKVVTNGTRGYAYDALGRMLTVSDSGTLTASLTYSGSEDVIASDGTKYAYDPSGGLAAVGTGTGGVHAWTDQHDDVVGQFTATGAALSGSSTYDPWGSVTSRTLMYGSLGYQSGWTDTATSQVGMGARWYDPSLGRFTSRDKVSLDPVPASVSANKFAYVNDNPLGGTDPTGECSMFDVVCKARSLATKAVSTVSHYASSASSYISSGYNYVSSYASQYYSYGRSYVSHAYSTAKRNVKKAVKVAVRIKKRVGRKIVDSYHHVKRSVSRAVHRVRQATARGLRVVKHYSRTVRHALGKAGRATVRKAVHVGRAVGKATKTAAKAVGRGAKATGKFLEHHAATIGTVVASTVAFTACEAVLTVGSAGTLSAPGLVACGAFAGAVGNAVGYGIKAAQSGHFDAGELARTTGEGALYGAAGGALGAAGGKALSWAGGKAMSALGRGASKVGDEAAEAGSGAGRVAGKADEGPGSSCRFVPRGMHSFAPNTGVLMADGSAKAISDIKLGDKVLALDAATGATSAQKVVALHRNIDIDLTDVTVRVVAPSQAALRKALEGMPRPRAAQGAVSGAESIAANAPPAKFQAGIVTAAPIALVTLHTTSHHPFWNDSNRRWTDAADLKVGTRLATADGAVAEVQAVHVWRGSRLMRDLTVDRVHTYFVEAAQSAVLVHNCGEDEPFHTVDVEVSGAGGPRTSYSVRSGQTTEAEASLGGGYNTQAATHTENRVARMSGASAGRHAIADDPFAGVVPVLEGESVTIRGKLPACSRCKGAMNRMVDELGASVTYVYDGPAGSGIWRATGRAGRGR